MKTLLVCAAMLACTRIWAQQPSTTDANAQNTAVLERKIRDLEDRVIALEGKLRTMESPQATAAPAQAPQPATPQATPPMPTAPATPSPTETQVGIAGTVGVGQVPVYGGGAASAAAAKALNPDISVIGDFVGAVGSNTPPPLASLQPFPSLEMHESEIGMQAIIDPYARGDFFISFGEEGVNLEEGYITFTALPAGFVAKVGKMRSVFGKVNMMHNHVLPWVDRPLVSTNLLGGEDGIDDAGFSLERILPVPKGIFLEATGQVFRGDSADVFQHTQRSDVSTVEHLRAYRDINESTNLDLGFSYARGHNNGAVTLPGNFITQLYGIDATVRWKPLRRSIYHSFVGRSEIIWSHRQQLPNEQKSFGFYTSGDYQFARRWFAGGRYDWSDRSHFANLTDHGVAATLTYWPSEFSQVRGEYRFTRYAENRDSNELLMQLIFSLGAHGAHPF